ncbi:MAG: hypothetical protein J2P36_38260, partial [Ktedonobacteraceae bacterium]|nr:hypothetical protein [Ktedonobacteraceae bacterium]
MLSMGHLSLQGRFNAQSFRNTIAKGPAVLNDVSSRRNGDAATFLALEAFPIDGRDAGQGARGNGMMVPLLL